MPETFQVWNHICCYKNSAEHSKDTGRAPNTRWCMKKQDWKCLFPISCAWRSSRCLIPPPSRQACVIPASVVTLTYNCVVKHQPVSSLCSCVSSGESQREGLGMACPSAWVRMEGKNPSPTGSEGMCWGSAVQIWANTGSQVGCWHSTINQHTAFHCWRISSGKEEKGRNRHQTHSFTEKWCFNSI